jgi:hypothetical protein
MRGKINAMYEVEHAVAPRAVLDIHRFLREWALSEESVMSLGCSRGLQIDPKDRGSNELADMPRMGRTTDDGGDLMVDIVSSLH